MMMLVGKATTTEQQQQQQHQHNPSKHIWLCLTGRLLSQIRLCKMQATTNTT